MAQFPLKHFPLDVRRRLLQVQMNMKIKKGISQYSIALTLCQIIKEHEEMEKEQRGVKK